MRVTDYIMAVCQCHSSLFQNCTMVMTEPCPYERHAEEFRAKKHDVSTLLSNGSKRLGNANRYIDMDMQLYR